MSIKVNDNFKVLTGKPINAVYYNNIGLPYTDETEALAQIPLAYRFLGLTINIAGDEYWFKSNLTSLIEKGGTSTSSNVVIDEDITLSGTTYGNYADGDTILVGTTLQEVFVNMMTLTQLPTMNLTPDSGIIEVGTIIDITLNSTWVQGDAGILTQYTLDKVYNSIATSLVDDTSIISYDDTTTDQILEGEELTYTAKVYYAQSELVSAGNIEDISIFTGVRAYFYVGDTGTIAPTTSALVRSLGNSGLNPQNNTSFTINIPSGATRVVFAYPDTLQAVSSVKYVELGNGEVKDTFDLTNVTVEGANSYTGIVYKIYTYIPAIPYGDSATYIVTI